MQCSFSLLVRPCRQASQERNTDRMVRDTQTTVRRPEENGSTVFVPKCRSVGRHWCAQIHEYPPCFFGLKCTRVCSHRSTIDAVAGDLRTNSHLHQQKQGTPPPLPLPSPPPPLPTAHFFLGWEAGANALASRAQDTCHEFVTFSSSSLRSGVGESKWRDLGFHEHVA